MTDVQIASGELSTERADPLDGYVLAWLMSYRDSRATREAYERDIRGWRTWCASRQPNPLHPLSATRQHLDAYAAVLANTINGRTGQPTAPASLARKLSAISSWYGYLLDEGIIERNPVARVKRPRIDSEATKATGLTAEEARRVLAAAGRDKFLGPELAAAVAGFLVHIGARVSEICAVDVDDISTDSGHRIVELRWMKGGKKRTRALPPPLCVALDSYLDHRARGANVDRADLSGPLFLTPSGQRLDRYGVYRFVRRAAKAAGLDNAAKLSPHSFRHAWATIARERGASLEDRQFALGHADPRTTQRYDRRRRSLDRDPSYLVAAAVSG